MELKGHQIQFGNRVRYIGRHDMQVILQKYMIILLSFYFDSANTLRKFKNEIDVPKELMIYKSSFVILLFVWNYNFK